MNTPKKLKELIGYPKVLLFPGHSPETPGAYCNGLKENSLAIGLGKMLAKKLGELNIPFVYNTVHGNVTEYLDRRIDIVKEIYRLDSNIIAIEIHFDAASNSSARGGHIIHYPGSIEGGKIAKCIQGRLGKIFPGRAEQIRERKLKFLKKTPCPAVIIEVCFLTNFRDMNHYLRKRKKVSEEIAQGLLDYIKKGGNNDE